MKKRSERKKRVRKNGRKGEKNGGIKIRERNIGKKKKKKKKERYSHLRTVTLYT